VINKIVTEIPKNPATVLNSASLNIAWNTLIIFRTSLLVVAGYSKEGNTTYTLFSTVPCLLSEGINATLWFAVSYIQQAITVKERFYEFLLHYIPNTNALK
jgi:hypothetical protein